MPSIIPDAPSAGAPDVVATDSEWDAGLADPWLSTAFASPTATVVFVRRDLSRAVRGRLDREAGRLGVRVLYVRRTDATDLLGLALPGLGVRAEGGKTRLAFFFSPKDVEYAVGWDRFREAINSGHVRQHNALTGCVGRVVLRDLCGWAGKTSLARFAAALGVGMPEKCVMDDYKVNMARGLVERPAEFLRYAVADARVLLDVYGRFAAFVQGVQRGVLGMAEDDVWSADTVPITVGRLVAETFRRWLVGQAGADAAAVRFCDRKLGVLDPDHDDYLLFRENRAEVVGLVRSPGDLAGLADDPRGRELLKVYHRAKYHTTALGGAGVRWFAGRPLTETAGFNALVHGGRCHNERPDQYAVGPGLDVDISGCYGASLRSLVYPVGVPHVWSYSPNEGRPTLGDWLAHNEADLVPGLWTCSVSGRLPFEQDLLYSKLVKHRDIRKAAADDGTDIPCDFALLRRELRNAVLTADLLAALRAVATNAEWAALARLEVVTAVAYRADDRADGPGGWARSVLAADDRGRRVRLASGTAADDRPRTWYGVALEGFVGRLVDERRRVKGVGPDGLDAVLKLLVNTLYGVFASRHFAVGNTVVANNITARARLGVWMTAKALGLRQCITDGGIYTPSAVPHYGGKRPGLDTLSRSWEWGNPRRGRTLAPLPGLDWTPGTPVPPAADAAALAHVGRFWSPYGLAFPFELEHKSGFTRAAYWSKGDNALLPAPEGEPVFKLRGRNREARTTDLVPHPTFALLRAILSEGDQFPPDLAYTRGGILKVGLYRTAQASKAGYAGIKHLRPGDSLPETGHTAVYNNAFHPIPDEPTYLRRRNRKRFHRGRPVEFFERFRGRGISGVHRAMAADRLTGAPVPPKTARTGGDGGA